MKSKNLHVGFNKNRSLGAWWWALAWAAVIFVLSSIPGTAYPETNVPGADKLVHVTVYAILGFLSARALSSRERWTPALRIVVSAALCGLFGITDELHQLFVPRRSCDWRDGVADIVGGLIGAVLFTQLVRWQTRRGD